MTDRRESQATKNEVDNVLLNTRCLQTYTAAGHISSGYTSLRNVQAALDWPGEPKTRLNFYYDLHFDE
jgi:hypothetical protein